MASTEYSALKEEAPQAVLNTLRCTLPKTLADGQEVGATGFGPWRPVLGASDAWSSKQAMLARENENGSERKLTVCKMRRVREKDCVSDNTE